MDHPAVSALVRWVAVSVLALLMAWVPDEAAAYGTVTKGAGSWLWGPGNIEDTMTNPSCVAVCQSLYPNTAQGCASTAYSGHACINESAPFGDPPNRKTATCMANFVSSNTCAGTTISSGQVQSQVGAKFAAGSCPPNSVAVGESCVCSKGYRRANQGMSGSACEPYSCQKGALSYANAGAGPLPQESAMAQRASCVGPGSAHAGCQMVFTPSSAKCADPTHCWATGTDATSGDYCDGPTPTSPTPSERPAEPAPAPAPCPTGQCPGTVNGLSGCFPCQTSTNSDGKTTTTKTNDDGTTTTTETGTKTTCDGDKCTSTTTTTTTTRNPDGTITSTGTGTEEEELPQEKFCEENPTSPLCKEGSFGGACAGGFTCDGDAVQCAVAKEQHQRNCQMFDTPTPLSIAGEQAANGQDRPQGHPLNDQTGTPFNFSSGINTSDALGGGGCPSDDTVTVSSLTLTIPWSRYCGMLNTIGELSVAVCMLAAALIVFRG